MTPKQQMACNYYLSGLSMRQACLKAGYGATNADNNASTIFRRKDCQAYIRERQKQSANAELADAIFVRNKLIEMASSTDKFVATNAIKMLDHHNEWNAELAAKYKALEAAQKLQEQPKESGQQIIINIQEAKKETEQPERAKE